MAGRVESEFRQRFTAVDHTGRAFRSLNSNLKRTERGFGLASKALGAFAGALSVGVVGRYVKQIADLGQGLQDAAEKTGLAVEEFTSFQALAKQSGIEARSFEMALQRLTRRIGEAANGQGELLKVVENYGLAIRDSQGSIRSTRDVLIDLADIISRTESAQEQLFLTTRAFDAEGADFVNILREGGEALARNAEIAGRYNTITETQTKQLGQLQTEWSEWGDILKSVSVDAVAGMSQALKNLSDNIQRVIAPTQIQELARLGNELLKVEQEIAKLESAPRNTGYGAGRLEARRLERQRILGEISTIQDQRRAARGPASLIAGTPSPAPVVGAAGAGSGTAAAEGGGNSVQQQIEQDRREYMEMFRREFDKEAGFEKRWAEQTNRVQEHIQEVNEFAQEAARSMQNAFSDFFFDPMDDGFRGLAQNFGDTIRRMAADIASQKLLTAFFGQFAGGTGLLADFANQALGAIGGNVIINAPGADASTVARIETVASRTESVIRDNARRGRLT